MLRRKERRCPHCNQRRSRGRRWCRRDVCIVGAGLAGLNALFVASQYLSRDQNVILVDRRRRVGGMWVDTYPYVRLLSHTECSPRATSSGLSDKSAPTWHRFIAGGGGLAGLSSGLLTSSGNPDFIVAYNSATGVERRPSCLCIYRTPVASQSNWQRRSRRTRPAAEQSSTAHSRSWILLLTPMTVSDLRRSLAQAG